MRKIRIRYKRVLIVFVLALLLLFLIFKFLSIRVSNIFVTGNSYFNDQYVIELAKLSNYPISIFNSSSSIKKRLISDVYIKDATVKKKGFSSIYISVLENRPLFYDSISNYTVLLDGSKVKDSFDVPILVNSVDNDVYDKFLSKMSSLDLSLLSSVSEIKYSPNDVDKELFLFTMNDGNYVYLNLNKFESINKYFDMVVNFNNHKGILYLDSGEYFKILDN